MPIEVNDKGELIAPESVYNNLRSDAMIELVSRKPGFLGRWALVIFLTILLLLLGSTWFIHYPDVIKAKAILLASNAPKEIIANQDGRLASLFVQNDQKVLEGEILGYIESNASHRQVLLLGTYLDTTVVDLQKNNTQNVVARFSSNFNALGELQPGYQQFMIAYQQFADYLQDGYYLKKSRSLAEDFSYLQKNHEVIQQQKTLILKDLNISEESYKANESLLKDKVISIQDDRNEQSKLLNKQLNIPQVNLSLLNNEIQQREKRKDINELEHSISQQKILFQQAVQTFQSLVNEWIKKYILKAPISGKLTLLTPLQENQYIKMGESLGFVNPTDTRYYAKVHLTQYNFGKIGIGQAVQLRFDAYPYQEFGFVKGELSYVTEFATDSGFIGQIRLVNGLATNQHKTLHYRDGLKAEAQIITKDMRLMERLYDNIVTAVKR